MRVDYVIEACIENPEDALLAESAGANRIEINSRLDRDGLTPSIETVQALRQVCQLPIVAMLRPHDRGFHYSSIEMQTLLDACDSLLAAGVQGIAFGGLTADGRLHIEHMRQIVRHCQPRQVVMHRAFDMLADQQLGLEQLVDCGVSRVLTSGGGATAELGIARLSELVAWSRGRIEILPGGGVNQLNARRILDLSGCTQLHGTFRKSASSTVRLDPQVLASIRDQLAQD